MSNVKKLCADLRDYIDAAKGMIERGEETSLVDLDAKVVTLCKEAETLQMKDFQDFANELEGLQKELGDLKQLMLTKRDEAAHMIGTVDAHKQASTAYTARKYTGDN